MNKLKAWFINAFKINKLRMLSFLFIWMIPLAILLYDGRKIKTAGMTFQLWVIPVLLIVLIIYYKKIKKMLRDKRLASDIRGVAVNPLIALLEAIMNVGTVYLAYCLINVLSAISGDINDYLIIVIVCFAVGGLCNIADSINKLQIGGKKDEQKS